MAASRTVRHAVVLGLVMACEPAPVPAVPVVAVREAVVPADTEALRGWLQSFAYRGWAPQTEIRETGEHGGERLYFNNLLATSMRVGATEHPVGSAAVRELYAGDLSTLLGFALMVKTGPSGDLAEGWFWYEIFGLTADAVPNVAEAGARACAGCHSHAVDFVQAPASRRDDAQPELTRF